MIVSGVGPRNCILDGVHIGASWQIWLNDCTVAMRRAAITGGYAAYFQITLGSFVISSITPSAV